MSSDSINGWTFPSYSTTTTPDVRPETLAAATRCVARAAERNNWTAEDFAEILHTLGLTAPTRHEEPR